MWREIFTLRESIRELDGSQTSCFQEHQERQLASFAVFRHNKGKLDKFRTLISRNADIIQRIATSVVDAACAAFPPSSAILTAFTFVMTASQHVSDDYDMIESFFKVMQVFLERLSLLEDKIPPQEAFQRPLVKVFSSLLKLSGVARSYCKKGRLSKWAKDLVRGGDAAAYEELSSDLSNLESTVIMQTLRTTIEISAQSKSTNDSMKAVYGLVEENSCVTQQTLEKSEQTRVIVSRNETVLQELHHMSRNSARANTEFLRILNQMKSKDEKSEGGNMKSDASKSANFNRLKATFLENDAEGRRRERLEILKSSYIEGAFEWFQAEPAFQSIVDKEESLLWVSGAAGMGKSTLSYAMFRYLEQKYATEPRTSVAWFSFDDEHSGMRLIVKMLQCCALQAAEKDAIHCRETDEALRRRGKLVFCETAATWEDLIELRYTAKSDRRLIIILDGIDAIENEPVSSDFTTLVQLLGRVKRNKYAVQVIFTCDREQENSLSGIGTRTIHLTRETIVDDMSLFVSSKIKSSLRLRKLRNPLRIRIVQKMMQKADCKYSHVMSMSLRSSVAPADLVPAIYLQSHRPSVQAIH